MEIKLGPRTKEALREKIKELYDDDFYESPIQVYYKENAMRFEDAVVKAVLSYNIVVDKDQLLDALRYDRASYQKGWTDALKTVVGELDAGNFTVRQILDFFDDMAEEDAEHFAGRLQTALYIYYQKRAYERTGGSEK